MNCRGASENRGMPSSTLAHLLNLSVHERAELAAALWESLTDGEREAELVLSPEQAAELDCRWAEHLADPTCAVAWDELRRKLLARE